MTPWSPAHVSVVFLKGDEMRVDHGGDRGSRVQTARTFGCSWRIRSNAAIGAISTTSLMADGTRMRVQFDNSTTVVL